MKRLENLIYKMLTENTGTHFLDSGGAYGRAWQRNQKKTLKDFRSRPECVLEISKYTNHENKIKYEVDLTIDLFQYLTKSLSLDEYCDAFNNGDNRGKPWDSEEFYGVSKESEEWLLAGFTPTAGSFNSYNHSANFSQVVQGRELEHNETGERYVLLQIHGSCDVRGGYTDARLFKLEVEYFLDERCGFSELDWMGCEFISHDGRSIGNEELEKIAKKILGRKKKIKITGHIFEG